MAKQTTRRKSAKTSTRKSAKTSTRKTAKTSARKATRKRAAKRELVNTGSDKRYVRRGAKGRFDESDDLGRANAGDRKRSAKTKATRGHGDRGDR
jgi:hypothetical protein